MTDAYLLMAGKLKTLDYAGTVTQLKQDRRGDRTTFQLEFDFLGKAKDQIAPKPETGEEGN